MSTHNVLLYVTTESEVLLFRLYSQMNYITINEFTYIRNSFYYPQDPPISLREEMATWDYQTSRDTMSDCVSVYVSLCVHMCVCLTFNYIIENYV